MIDKQKLDELLCRASEICVGKEDVYYYEDWILFLFWMKYLSDLHKESVGTKRLPYVLYEHSTFSYFYEHREDEEIIELLREGLSRFGTHIGNNATFYNIFMALNLYQNLSRLRVEDTEVIRKLLELFHEVDLTGNEPFDLFGYAFHHFRHWNYSFHTFRSYI